MKRILQILIVMLLLAIVASLAAAQDDAPRPFLGITFENSENGAVITRVQPGSPADAAGLQAGDVITALNGAAITGDELAAAVAAYAAGDAVTISVERDGESLDLDATLGERQVRRSRPETRINVIVFNPADESWQVIALEDDSDLYAAGLRAGDRITAVMIDGEAVAGDALMQVLEDTADDAETVLTVERDGETLELTTDAAALGLLVAVPRLSLGDGGWMPFDHDQGMMRPDNVRLGVAFSTTDDGAVITEVLPDTPAAEVGLLVDDVIVAVDGDVVDAERTLRDRLLAYEPGDTVTLDVLRSDERLSLEVTLTGGLPFNKRMPRFFRFGPGGRFTLPEMPEIPATPEVPEVQPNT